VVGGVFPGGGVGHDEVLQGRGAVESLLIKQLVTARQVGGFFPRRQGKRDGEARRDECSRRKSWAHDWILSATTNGLRYSRVRSRLAWWLLVNFCSRGFILRNSPRVAGVLLKS